MAFTTLVDSEALDAHLADPHWVVFDCRFQLTDTGRGEREWAQGHIPGARYAHLDRDLSSPLFPGSGRHPLPDPARLAAWLGKQGVGADTQVVVYDDSFGAVAARLWWLLRWLGHEQVALLDGGLPAWSRQGGALSRKAPEIQAAEFAATPCDDMWLDSAGVEAALESGQNPLLLDARAEERFRGEREPLDKVAGHIPGSVNLPYDDNLAFDGRFAGAAELAEQYGALLEGRSPRAAIHLCGSGVTACHNLLAMEVAGLRGSRLYAGSWSEWIEDPRRPVA
ncbi:MAG: sulfurtransferase [Gammaproteobacteria bacterium]|nr:sulfurtransferase [Gammaproteobacteria bacterium]